MVCVVLWAFIASACLILDQPEEPDPDDPPLVPAHTQAVQATALFPAADAVDVALNTPLWVEFDQHLVASRLIFFNTLSVKSRGLGMGIRSHYEMVDKRVVARLTRDLEAGLVYTMKINIDNVRGLSGAPMLESPEIIFRAGDHRVEGREETLPTWTDDIEPLIDASCGGCHRAATDDAWFADIHDLAYENLIKDESAQWSGRHLVVPFQPASSYLMHKLIEDYPSRAGSMMPPPWTSDFDRLPTPPTPLTRDDLRLIERWIRIGAPR